MQYLKTTKNLSGYWSEIAVRFGGKIPFNGSEIPITGVMMAIRWLEVPSKVNNKQASPMKKK